MPVPKPTGDESQSEYMQRCMHFLAHEPGSDRPQEQMVAICLDLWRSKDKSVVEEDPSKPDTEDDNDADKGAEGWQHAIPKSHRRREGQLSVALEIKSLSAREFQGYGSVFGNVDLGGDVVLPGAFSKSLAAHSDNGTLPQMFWMHDPSRVPGKWLSMHEDDHGLFVHGQLAPTPLGDEMHALMKMDAVRGLSIGYMVDEDSYDKAGNRLLKSVDLWETSLVSLAMNPLANVTHAKSQLSSAGEYVPSPREWEQVFRDMGCSRRQSRQLVSKLFAAESSVTPDSALNFSVQGLSGVMPDRSRCDAANSELERALDELRDLALACCLPKFR